MATRRYQFKFHAVKDGAIIARLDSKENMQQYIRSLILSDIAADSLRDLIKYEADPDPVPDETEESEPDNESIEFQRRADLMARYCHGSVSDNDPDYCYSCVWSYHPENYSDVIRCKFDGLSSDEMKELIRNWHNHIKEVTNNGFDQ